MKRSEQRRWSSTRVWRHRALGSIALVGALWSPALSLADDSSTADAEAAFREGAALYDEGRYAEACPKIEGAVKLAGASALGGKLLLAQCFERIGRTASAWGLYAEVAAKSSDNPERAGVARAAEVELVPKLHYVVIRTSAENRSRAGFTIQKNQSALPLDLLGSKLPVDPGPLRVRAEAEGFEPLESILEIPSTAGETVFELADLAPTPVNAPAPAGDTEGSFWSPGKVAGLVIGATGLGALGGGIILGAFAAKEYDAALVEGQCVGDTPPLCRDRAPVDDALAIADAGTGLVIAGSLLTVTGVLLVLLVPSSELDAPAVAFDFGLGGASLRGTF